MFPGILLSLARIFIHFNGNAGDEINISAENAIRISFKQALGFLKSLRFKLNWNSIKNIT